MCDGRLWDDVFGPCLDGETPPPHALRYVRVDYGEQDTVTGMARKAIEYAGGDDFAIMGISLGGIVGMEIMRMVPKKIFGVFLFDTNHLAETEERQAMRAIEIKDVMTGGLRSYVIEQMKPRYLGRETLKKKELFNRINDLVLDMAVKLGVGVFKSQSIALRDRFDYSETLQSYDGNVWLACGEDDSLCNLDKHHQMAKLLAKSKVTAIPNSGHLPCLENPQFTQQLITNWESCL